MVGVGDGPFDSMKDFDQGAVDRRFDNFHFIDFSVWKEKSMGLSREQQEAAFAAAALAQVPAQIKVVTLGVYTWSTGVCTWSVGCVYVSLPDSDRTSIPLPSPQSPSHDPLPLYTTHSPLHNPLPLHTTHSP